jgi:hypothetical protein
MYVWRRPKEWIGEITYSIWEDKRIKEFPVVNVLYDEGRLPSPFVFAREPYLDRRKVGKRIYELDDSMDNVSQLLHDCYSPIFPELEDILKEIFCERTFFESPKAFKKMHSSSARGIYYDSRQNGLHGMIPAGIHVGYNNSKKSFEETIMHEYGHQFLTLSCKYNLTSNNYRYDNVMSEVFAILFERQRNRSRYKSKPHKEAWKLVRKLEKIPRFNDWAFHRKWTDLLPFTKHEELVEYIGWLGNLK